MTRFRIRAISNGIPSDWLYTQENVQSTSESLPEVRTLNEAETTQTNVETNQFGRFRYSEKQYGRLNKPKKSSLTFDTTPIRIRFSNGSYLYTQSVSKQGVTRGVRARCIYKNGASDWIYSQSKEV